MNIIIFDNLEAENNIKTNSRAGNHILSILKLKEGDEFKAGVWGQNRGICHITEVNRENIYFTYEVKENAGKRLPLILLLSQIRPICMRRILRYAGECGLWGIILTDTDLTDRNYVKASLYTTGEWKELLRQGTEFSADSAKPEVFFTSSVSESIELADELGAKNKIVLDICEKSEKLIKPSADLSVLAIGGERGWTDRERKFFFDSKYKVMNLGDRVLRTEESAFAAVFPWL